MTTKNLKGEDMDNLLKSKKQWLRPADLVHEFSISRTTVYTWAAQGAFGVPWQPGGINTTLLFHRDEVIKAIQRSREILSEREGTLPVE